MDSIEERTALAELDVSVTAARGAVEVPAEWGAA